MNDNTKIYLGEKAAEIIAHGVDEEIKKRATNYSLCADGDGIQIDGGFGGRIFSSDLDYSTEEQLTGKRWIDGKPIYQKTIVENCDYTGVYNSIRYFYKTLISDVDSLIDSCGIIEFDNGDGIKTCFFPLGEGDWNSRPSLHAYTLIQPETTDVKFYLVINTSDYTFTSFKIIATVLYTKISDTELSPVSLPKIKSIHNYSTEEQIVGTWIDGKPIYEKVIHVENFIIGNNEIPLENLDTIINYSGNLIFTDYPGHKRVFPYIQNNNTTKVVINNYNDTKFVVASGFNCNTIDITIQYTKTTD